ncbi:MAG: Gfo/Idh/MocA family oxidoreductase [Terriglobia bacterium]
MKNKSRRKFLQNSVALSAMAGSSLLTVKPVVPQTRSSASRVVGANDRIRIAQIGCGGMGRADLRDSLRVKNVECIALCDVDDSQIAKILSEIVEPASQKPGLMARDYRKVLELKDLDAVVVSTPDHWHALPTVAACEAGKDVYVEKPLSLTIAEGRIMVDAARKYGRVVQMGTQQRSATHYQMAIDYVKSGKLGRIRLVRAWAYLDWKGETPVLPDGPPPAGVDYDFWLGPAPKRPFNPNRFHFTFRWYWDYAGGLMTDWGAHMIDIANWGMGIKAPSSAFSVGGKFGYPHDAMETPDTQQVIWAYPEFSMVWEHALGIGRGPEAREHGVSFHGEMGVLVVDRDGWEVFAETDKIDKKVRIYKTVGVPFYPAGREEFHLLHVQNFYDCMRTRKRPNSDVEIGHNSMIACHLGNIAFRLGRQVNWDVENEKVIGDEEAQKYISRPYRSPWKLTT